jgi:hypothetical protein
MNWKKEYTHFGKIKNKNMELSKFYQLQVYQSDKGTLHDYIDAYYNSIFTPLKDEKIELLEIGVASGGSIELWAQFFANGNITGLDNREYGYVPVLENINIKICDAYSDEVVNQFIDNTFDFIIDDGPHTLESQIFFIQKYLPKVKSGGRLIIEDIQTVSDLDILKVEASNTNMDWKVFDLRNNKGRYDDIIIEIIKK